jgi:GAF domain-containing protein
LCGPFQGWRDFPDAAMNNEDKYKKLYLILHDISNATVITDTVISIGEHLLDVAIKYVDAESGSLMIMNERGGLSILSSRGLDADYIKTFSSQNGAGISSAILEKRAPVLIQDIARHPDFLFPDRNHYKTRSFISCPILFRNQPLGIININDKKDGASFTQDELDLLQVIANHAAVALENHALLKKLKTAAADLEQMNRRLIDSDIIKTEFLKSISHELRTPLNAIKGAIYYLENQNQISTGERSEFHGIISSEASSLANTIDNFIRFLEVEDESLLLDKAPVNIVDILNSLPSSGHLKSVLSNRSIQLSIIPPSGPLWIVGDALRISQMFTNLLLGLTHYLSSDDTIDLSLSSTNDMLSFCINLSKPLPRTILEQLNSDTSLNASGSADDRVRIYLARNTAIAHRWNIVATNEATVSRIIMTCPLNRKEILDAYVNKSIDLFVDYISESLDIDICSVMLSDELTGELRVTSARGLDDKVVKTTSIKQGDKIAGWVAMEGKPLFISNIETDARFAKKSIPQYNSKALMSLPLKIDDRVIGVLNLNNKKSSQPFCQQDFERAQILIDSFSGHLRHAYSKQFSEAEIFQLIESLDSKITYPYSTRRPRR